MMICQKTANRLVKLFTIKPERTTTFMVLLTLGLFFSKVLVFVTPLPFIYHQLKTKGATSRFVTQTLVGVALAYVFGVELFLWLQDNHPLAALIFPVPLVELALYFSSPVVLTFGLLYFAIYLSLGFAIGLALQKAQSKAFVILMITTVAVFVVVGVAALILAYPQAAQILGDYRAYLTTALGEFIKAQESSGIALEEVLELKNNMPEYILSFFFMLPFGLLATIAFLLVFNLVIAKRFFSKIFKDLGLINLTEFRLPFVLVWVVFGLLVGLVINKKFLHNNAVFYTLLNLILSLAVAYFFQGLAVVMNFLRRHKVDIFFRILLYLAMIFMAQSTAVFLAVIGFFDNWMDLRKLDKNARASRNRNDTPQTS